MNPAWPIAVLLLPTAAWTKAETQQCEWGQLVRLVRAASFPELSKADIRIRFFESESDYFQARFSISRFVFMRKMRYFIRVNSTPALQTASDESKRAIMAHELAHLTYYTSGNRLRLFGLLRLSEKSFRQDFERRTDLEVIRRGYAQGLKQYRFWLYQHVPARALAEKRRDYLSPEEIDEVAKK